MNIKKLGLICLLGLLGLQPVLAQDEDIMDHPGYVDFSTLSAIAGEEPNVEVSLKEPLLRLITNILKNNDEQAADFISTLLRVNVTGIRKFDVGYCSYGRDYVDHCQ